MACETNKAVLLPTFPQAEPLTEAVLFGFDDRAFPFQTGLQTHLLQGRNPQVVLDHGPEGSHDEWVRFYGTVIRVDGVFHMWYYGNNGPQSHAMGAGHGTHPGRVLCYATSPDGIAWEKPSLGFVEYRGSKKNNIVDFPEPAPRPAAPVLYEADEPDASRRYKMLYEADRDGRVCMCVAYSADGLRWALSENNPVGPFCEMAGITKFRGMYYVSGQDSLTAHRPFRTRVLATFASADFEHWSPCAAVGLDRSDDLVGPSNEGEWNNREEVHLGAAMWNRENVILGVYGQWHGNDLGDRRLVSMDLGLALTHDAIHYHEPIPDFRFIPAREQPESPDSMPSLMQGQGMENVGDRTLYWYSTWKAIGGTGVRMISWERDRLGMLRAFIPSGAVAISCPFRVVDGGKARVFVNAAGLGEHSRLRLSLVDAGFRPVPGYSGDEAAIVAKDDLRGPVVWPEGKVSIGSGLGELRIRLDFSGLRPEDARLHAVYLAGEGA